MRNPMPVSPLSERIANEITRQIQDREFPVGSHLSTQMLADTFRVSRSPVRIALELLAKSGVLEQRTNRGFFVKNDVTPAEAQIDVVEHSDVPATYHRFAEDWLRDKVPAEVTEQFLRDHYEMTKTEVIEMLTRAGNEGWVERKEGYGWRLLSVAKTPEAFEQIYRFRAVVEPAAILEPTFSVDRKALDDLRRTQEALVSGQGDKWSADKLISSGTDFHEHLAKFANNPFFHQAVVRADRMRRLLEYRTVIDRSRIHEQAAEHLEILSLIERGENLECSYLMKRHLLGALKKKAATQRALGFTDI